VHEQELQLTARTPMQNIAFVSLMLALWAAPVYGALSLSINDKTTTPTMNVTLSLDVHNVPLCPPPKDNAAVAFPPGCALGAYQIEIEYDSSVVTFLSADFGARLGDLDGVDYFSVVDTPKDGEITLIQSSFLTPIQLLNAQGPPQNAQEPLRAKTFRLADLYFLTKSEGVSPVEVTLQDHSDAMGTAFTLNPVSNGSITVVDTPEPSRYIAAAGLFLIWLSARRRPVV
jgi:hypothetical protein